jgi:archaemetzincin
MGGPCAVVSSPPAPGVLRPSADPNLFRQRVIKEAVHELGHTVSLTHCDDYSCAMAASHAVEWIDLKESTRLLRERCTAECSHTGWRH